MSLLISEQGLWECAARNNPQAFNILILLIYKFLEKTVQ